MIEQTLVDSELALTAHLKTSTPQHAVRGPMLQSCPSNFPPRLTAAVKVIVSARIPFFVVCDVVGGGAEA